MTTLSFSSVLAPTLRALVEHRQALGYGDRNVRSLLAHFDRYLVARRWSRPILTRPLVEDWAAASSTPLKPRSRAQRLHVMRLLGRFLAQTHPTTYIPGPAWGPRQPTGFRPHIYTLEEIRGLLAEAARLTPAGSLRPRTYTTLLGLLYSTGLRISEALALRLSDVDPEQATLWVRESKFHRSRAVPIPQGVVAALERYRAERGARGHLQEASAPFFVNERRRACSYPVVCATFLTVARRIGLRGPPGTPGPRLHDLRHAFAVHRLLAWYRDGGDVQARLPLLTDYMGHVSLVSTQTYLEITAELLGEATRRFRPPTLSASRPLGEIS
jgi:integrase/recombinase XerD